MKAFQVVYNFILSTSYDNIASSNLRFNQAQNAFLTRHLKFHHINLTLLDIQKSYPGCGGRGEWRVFQISRGRHFNYLQIKSCDGYFDGIIQSVSFRDLSLYT